MGAYLNSDGLFVRLGTSESVVAKGGSDPIKNGNYEVEIDLAVADFGSATHTIPNSADVFGIVIPKGARIEEIETFVQTAFTVSAGTVAAATVVLGLKKASDRSTELDHDGFLTTSATGTALGLATAGTKTTVKVGSTGAGSLIGTTLSENGVITVANTTIATNVISAGALKVRVRYFYP